MGLKVKRVDKIADGSFGGLHCAVARELKIPFPYSCDTILLARGEGKATLKHEKIEMTLMKPKREGGLGLKYRRAHELTKKLERL